VQKIRTLKKIGLPPLRVERQSLNFVKQKPLAISLTIEMEPLMEWSPQQAEALSAVSSWYADPRRQVFYLAGFAGTGKTTLAQHLVEGVDGEVLFMAYTGKAASVLRERGCPGASTIHSVLYSVKESDRRKLAELQIELEEAALYEDTRRVAELRAEINAERQRLARPKFALNPESPLKYAKLAVLDECSMVNKEIAADLMSFGVKLLVLGDPAQLPPVKGHGYFTNRPPDLLLTEIHRQAADNPIIRWATAIRNGDSIPYGDAGLARKVRKDRVSVEELMAAGQVLCGTNENRRKLNRLLRHQRGYEGLYPLKGDKLVCLKNNRDIGLLNGVICEAMDHATADEDDLSLSVRIDSVELPGLTVSRAPFDVYANESANKVEHELLMADQRHLEQFDFGYALTVHKSQGSQWGDVMLWDDGFAKREPGMRRKWLYTAVTRAQHTLTIAA
jgi:exodeoxyribonuclease-5